METERLYQLARLGISYLIEREKKYGDSISTVMIEKLMNELAELAELEALK